MTCFRYFGSNSLNQVDNMTPYEYRLLLKAKELQEIDEQYHIHLQAFLNMTAQAEKQVGKKRKKVFTTFKKFFDYEKAINRALGIVKEDRYSSLAKFVSEQAKKKED